MKSLQESLLNEAYRPREYAVAVIGCTDDEGLPMSLKIVLDEPTRDRVKAVENWLLREEGNTFSHCEGGNIEY